jgi:hypothetical protein
VLLVKSTWRAALGLGVLAVVAGLPSCELVAGIGDLPYPADAADSDAVVSDAIAADSTKADASAADAGADGGGGDSSSNDSGTVCVLGISRVGHCTLTH